MSGPRRQHSFRDRLHTFGLSFQSKKDEGSSDFKDLHSKLSTDYSPTATSKCGYVNPLVDDSMDALKWERRPTCVLPSEVSMKPLGYNSENDNPGMMGKRSMSVAYSDKERKYLYRYLSCPEGTTSYIVQSSDTLAGIAARHHTTPSELVKINKLSSRLIFPGQRLFVPENKQMTSELPTDPNSETALSQASPKPGHVERIQSPTGSKSKGVAAVTPHHTPSFLAEELDKECLERFLKIKTRYITDGEGVIAGVLIVTPNVLMFDPNVSDPLVIEHGSDKYGVIVPMEMVIRVALYWDIARMALKNAPQPIDTSKTEVYHAKRPSFVKSHSADSEKSTTSEHEEQQNLVTNANTQPSTEKLVTPVEDKNLQPELKGIELTRISEETLIHSELSSGCEQSSSPKHKCEKRKTDGDISSSNKDDKILETSQPEEPKSNKETNGSQIENELSSSREPDSSDSGKHISEVDQGTTLQEISERKLSSGNSSQSLSSDDNTENLETIQKGKTSRLRGRASGKHNLSKSAPVSEDEDWSVEIRCKKATQNHKIRTSDPGSLIVYKNMVENKPDLFKSLEELVPRPAQSSEDSPLYLCIRMGRRIEKSLSRSSPIMDYGKMKIKREHWFSIPRDRVDSLYFFFQRWMPDSYGDIDDVNLEDMGFIPITSDEEEEEEEDHREEGDVVKDKPQVSSLELAGIPPPELLEKSDILNEQQEILLSKHLPARAVGYPWTLIYSTSKHGFSLKTLYREMAKYETPILLVIANTLGDIFGAVISCTLRLSEHFYGTGESFLFTFTPEFKCYHWTGENMYFVKGNPGSLAIGAGDGQFGLWLDDDLFHGRSNECKTFGNITLTKHEDFVIRTLEAWGFV